MAAVPCQIYVVTVSLPITTAAPASQRLTRLHGLTSGHVVQTDTYPGHQRMDYEGAFKTVCDVQVPVCVRKMCVRVLRSTRETLERACMCTCRAVIRVHMHTFLRSSAIAFSLAHGQSDVYGEFTSNGTHITQMLAPAKLDTDAAFRRVEYQRRPCQRHFSGARSECPHLQDEGCFRALLLCH